MLDVSALKKRPPTTLQQQYSARDTILYALSVGAGRGGGGNTDELPLVYEEELRALPTLAAVLASPRFWATDLEAGFLSRDVLHSAQSLTLHQPVPPHGLVSSETRLGHVYDKGPGGGALVHTTRQLRDSGGRLIADIGTTIFIRGAGGFGGERGPSQGARAVPERQPDATIEIAVRPEQNLLYRLNGDDNPLHVNPEVARAYGFDRPILHGLCSYGMMARALVTLCCPREPQKLTRLDTYFTSPVYPSDTLRLEVWFRNATQVDFRCLTLPRGVVALDRGYAEFSAPVAGGPKCEK